MWVVIYACVIRVLLYSDVLSVTGWGVAVACAACFWMFIVVLHGSVTKVLGKVQYSYLHIAITSSFQILHHFFYRFVSPCIIVQFKQITNQMQQFFRLNPDIYLQLSMFRVFSRPSSGAQRLQ
jgi:hypothetical protein